MLRRYCDAAMLLRCCCDAAMLLRCYDVTAMLRCCCDAAMLLRCYDVTAMMPTCASKVLHRKTKSIVGPIPGPCLIRPLKLYPIPLILLSCHPPAYELIKSISNKLVCKLKLTGKEDYRKLRRGENRFNIKTHQQNCVLSLIEFGVQIFYRVCLLIIILYKKQYAL